MSKEDGVLLLNGQQVGSTKQCCHCGKHFMMIKGSGKLRGFCLKCRKITCGCVECCTCVPYEKQIENLEKGLPATTV